MSVLVGACLSAAGAAYQACSRTRWPPRTCWALRGRRLRRGAGHICRALKHVRDLRRLRHELLTVVLVFWVSRHAKGERVLGLVLAGIMVSSLFQAGTSFIKLAADPTNKLPEITYWLMGSLSGMEWKDLGFVIWPMLIGLAPLFFLRWS